MIKITGKTNKSEIANAIQKYNGAVIYSYGDFLPSFTECYHVDKSEATVKEFCNFILHDLIEKTKDGAVPMIVIYTNESDLESIGILEDYAVSNYEKGGYVMTAVVISQ